MSLNSKKCGGNEIMFSKYVSATTEYKVEHEGDVFVVYSYVTRTNTEGKKRVFKNYVAERLNYPAAEELAKLLKLLEKPEM